jgi:3-oxoacyl-[acyl-carrier protein] reductase
MSESKVIVITGASRGIGAELLRGFARNGLKVVLNYSKSDETGDTLFADIALFTEDILKVRADVVELLSIVVD